MDHNWFNETLQYLKPHTQSILHSYCQEQTSIGHPYFQMANTFLFISYLMQTKACFLFRFCCTIIACVFFILWSYAVLCLIDGVLWNAAFVTINLIHVILLCYEGRCTRFRKEIEILYVELFKPLRVRKDEFKMLLKCVKPIRKLKYQEVFAEEKVTKVDYISVLLSGKLAVSQNGHTLQTVLPYQFLESPEWFGVSTDDYFQVSITALEDSKILLWHRDQLRLSIMSNCFLKTAFDHILSRDVVQKLFQVTPYANGYSSNNRTEYGDSYKNILTLIKRSRDGSGITALINRQLQGKESCTWYLGKIEETDHETHV